VYLLIPHPHRVQEMIGAGAKTTVAPITGGSDPVTRKPGTSLREVSAFPWDQDAAAKRCSLAPMITSQSIVATSPSAIG
jgi:hypothetical protein